VRISTLLCAAALLASSAQAATLHVPAEYPFGTEAAITLLYGLVAFGQIMLRRIDGHEQLPAFLAKEWCQAA